MENKGLLFIPDISGFTRFVNETDIDHSRLIIQELLELLINANDSGLEISEIEGDAILFYKFGEPPELDQLYKQVAKMFCAFHQHLSVYNHYRFCQCKACVSAVNLTLKVITHYGEFTSYSVKSFNKLIGRDIIVAHQLLKNDIDQHEYWLVTSNLVPGTSPNELTAWMQWNQSSKLTENGQVPFVYTQLSELKNTITPEIIDPPELTGKAKMLSLTETFNTDMITLFHATGDFQLRNRWQEDVLMVEDISHFLPRVGMHCRCIKKTGATKLQASSYTYTESQITFSETDEKEKSTTYYTLRKNSENSIQLNIDYYINKNFIAQWLFNRNKKKQVAENFRISIDRLHSLVKELNFAYPPSS